MPGTKRRIDEDLWLQQQLKKFKFSQVNANVYASTLAKLRQGARNFFSSRQLDGNQDISTNNDDNVPNQEPASRSSDANNSRLNRSAQGDDMELDVLSENEGANVSLDNSFCEECQRNNAWNQNPSLRMAPQQIGPLVAHAPLLLEKCNFCEKNVCHLSYCKTCNYGFCGSCCITSYDEPNQDNFVCITCFRQ